MKNKKVILKTKDQKNIKMSDIQNNEIVETKPQDNRLKSIMRKVLIIRKMDVDERLEQEALLDTYRNVLGIF